MSWKSMEYHGMSNIDYLYEPPSWWDLTECANVEAKNLSSLQLHLGRRPIEQP